jgi:membrane protein required for colicin V production
MPIDLVFLVVLFYGFWKGYNRGIISTVFSLGAYIFGFILAFKITPTTTNILEAMFHSTNPIMFLAAFAVNVLFILFIIRMAANSAETVFQAAALGIFNRFLGAMLVGAFSVLIYSILIWFLVKIQFLNEATVVESRSYPVLKEMPGRAKAIATRFTPFLKDVWGTTINWMDRLQSYGMEKTEGPSKIYDPDKSKGIENEPASPVSNEGTGIE